MDVTPIPHPPYEWDENKRQDTLTLRGLDFALVTQIDWGIATYRREASTTAALLVPVVIAGVGNDFAGLWPDASVSIGTTTEQSQPDGVPSIPAG